MTKKLSPSSPPTPTHDDLIKALLLRPRLLVDFFRAFVPGCYCAGPLALGVRKKVPREAARFG